MTGGALQSGVPTALPSTESINPDFPFTLDLRRSA